MVFKIKPNSDGNLKLTKDNVGSVYAYTGALETLAGSVLGFANAGSLVDYSLTGSADVYGILISTI